MINNLSTRIPTPDSSFECFDPKKVQGYRVYRSNTDNKLFDACSVNSKSQVITYENTSMSFDEACEVVQMLNERLECKSPQ